MARIKSLGFFQKVVLAVVLAMAVVFTVVYAVTTARVGFSYKDAILVPAQEGRRHGLHRQGAGQKRPDHRGSGRGRDLSV